MAGIGFKIQKVLTKDSYLSALQGYLLGSFVAAGPWLTVALSIGSLTALSQGQLSMKDFFLFRTTLVYIYAISLILVGIIQMPATRYVADALFIGEYSKILPTMLALILVTTLTSAGVGYIAFSGVGLGMLFLFRAVSLLVLISNIWVMMIFITATKHYIAVSSAFILGCTVGVVCGHYMGQAHGLLGYIEGCALGQAVILISLIAIMVREFPCDKALDFSVFAYLKRYPDLLFIGFFFNLGWWVNKYLLWNSEFGETVGGYFRTFNLYDSVSFITYLTVIPSLTVFFIRAETSFYVRYRNFFDTITARSSLEAINQAKNDLLDELGTAAIRIFWVQLSVTIFCFVCSTDIMKLFHLSPAQWSMYRISLLGAMIFLFVQLLSTILLYFEFRLSALAVATVFCFGSIIFTKIVISLGYAYIGYGLTTAAFLALIVGYLLAERNLKRLLYFTFVTQPIPQS